MNKITYHKEGDYLILFLSSFISPYLLILKNNEIYLL